jgi:hypothetical protein
MKTNKGKKNQRPKENDIEFVLIGVILLIGTRADEYIVQFERKQTLAVLACRIAPCRIDAENASETPRSTRFRPILL